MYFVRNDSMAFLFLDPKWKYLFFSVNSCNRMYIAGVIFQTRFRKLKNYRKMYFKMNRIASTYINALIFFSFASPVIRLITT